MLRVGARLRTHGMLEQPGPAGAQPSHCQRHQSWTWLPHPALLRVWPLQKPKSICPPPEDSACVDPLVPVGVYVRTSYAHSERQIVEWRKGGREKREGGREQSVDVSEPRSQDLPLHTFLTRAHIHTPSWTWQAQSPHGWPQRGLYTPSGTP